MVFIIRVQITGSGLIENERLMRKIRLVKSFANVLGFENIEEELWDGPSIKAMGGKLIASDDKILDIINKTSPLKIPDYTYRLRATYDNEPIYVYIHNKRFKQVYGDIVLSSDIFLKKVFQEEFQNKLVKAFSELKEEENLKGIRILVGVIGFNPDALEDVRERLMSYYDHIWRFVHDMFRTMKIESEEIGNVYLVKFLKPYSLEYLSKKIISISQFESFFESLSKRAKIKRSGGSILLFGESENSFRTIYKNFRDDFINSLRAEWYDDERIAGLLKRWLGKYASLSKYT